MKKIRHNFNKGIKLHLACANDLRPVMNCIYFKDGYAIASNGMILIKACLNEICNFSGEEKELLEGKLISAKNFKEIIKHTIIEIQEAEHFPDGPHDDQVDGGSGAYNYLSGVSMGKAAKSPVPPRKHLS